VAEGRTAEVAAAVTVEVVTGVGLVTEVVDTTEAVGTEVAAIRAAVMRAIQVAVTGAAVTATQAAVIGLAAVADAVDTQAPAMEPRLRMPRTEPTLVKVPTAHAAVMASSVMNPPV
jgi:hypothetical protein